MKKYANYYIHNPCNERWEEMKKDSGGNGFCYKCQSTVYNISGLSPEAFEQLWNEHKGNVCVRVDWEMIGSRPEMPVTFWDKTLKHWQKIAASVVAFIGFGTATVAQKANSHEPKTEQTPKLETKVNDGTVLPHRIRVILIDNEGKRRHYENVPILLYVNGKQIVRKETTGGSIHFKLPSFDPRVDLLEVYAETYMSKTMSIYSELRRVRLDELNEGTILYKVNVVKEPLIQFHRRYPVMGKIMKAVKPPFDYDR